MKFALLSTASVVALAGAIAPAFAADDFTGVVQLDIGRASQSGSPYVGDPTIYGGKAKGLWPLSADVHLQADLFVEKSDGIIDNWGPQLDADSDLIGGAIHLLHPFENRARFGLAGSVWNSDAFVPAGNGLTDVTYGLVAVEGQFFGTDWSFMAQAGAFTKFDCSGACPGALEDGVFLRGKVRYFLHDNTVLTLESVRMWGGRVDDVFGLKNLDSTQWIVEAEHRFKDSEFSVFANLSQQNVDSSTFVFGGVDATGGMIGVKFYYDQASLRSNDRDGAELDTPTFGAAPPVAGAISTP